MTKSIDFKTILPKYHSILDRGLSSGVGDPNGQMCIEAAACAALDLPHATPPGPFRRPPPARAVCYSIS